MKTATRLRARELRADEGRSVKEIARLLDVSQSSVSLWVRDVELTEAQRRYLSQRACALRVQSRREHWRERRRTFQSHGRRLARQADAFHAAGCMLYWAEGSKSRNAAQICNADPEVMRFFVRFLRAYFEVSDEKFRVTCNLFADHLERQREIEQFWLDTLELPRESLCRSIVNVYSKYSQKKRKNRLPHGTCRLCVNSTAVVQSIFGSIQEYGGFERPEWLG
jgi:predicted transcriptional regulator